MHTHRVPGGDFESVAAGGTDESGSLRAGQVSKRRLLIYAVVREIEARAPALFRAGHVAENWTVLAQSLGKGEAAAEDALLHPAVGKWGMHTLRRLLGTVTAEWPLADDVGYLGGVAGVAALRAGLAVEVWLRVRADGTMAFPSFGLLQSMGNPGWASARVRVEANELEVVDDAGNAVAVTSPDDHRWWAVRKLTSSVGGQAIEVFLDDVDPFRAPDDDLSPEPRVDTAAAARWQFHLDEAWTLLVEHHGPRAAAIASGVSSLIPLRPSEREPELSASSGDSFGGVALTAPHSGRGLAVALVHECQHVKLSALLDLVELVDPGAQGLHYAPWRADPRPARGLLQGAYAYLGVVQFWQIERLRPGGDRDHIAHFEFARWRGAVARVIRTLQESNCLTDEGGRFLKGMSGALTPLLGATVPGLPLQLALNVEAENELAWRLRNLRPDQATVEALVSVWRTGRPPRRLPASSALEARGRESWTSSRQRLARLRLSRPDGVLDVSAIDLAGIREADLAYALGDYARAAQLYSNVIQAGDGSEDAWAGLALAHRQRGSPAAHVLGRQPETVRALHEALGTDGPSPEAIAEWMAATWTGDLDGGRLDDR